MHVVIIDTTLSTPPTGGAQTFLIDFAQALTKRRIRLSVVTQPGKDSSTITALKNAEAEVREALWKPSHLPEEKAPLLAAWINNNEVDFYVISISPDVGWLALPLLDPSISTFSIAHNDIGAFYEPLKHYHPFMDCAIAVSENIRGKIVACGVPAERTTNIAYGVHPLAEAEVVELLKQSEAGPLRIAYVGRMVQEQKRVMEFAPLVAELVRREVNFELHLIGDGHARVPLETELSRMGFQDRVKFSGWLSSTAVSKRLRQMDAFVLLSDYEGLPVALLEALGHALVPVVTIIDSGNLELVSNGQNGFALPVGDTEGFAERLERLAHDREMLKRLRRAAWQTSLGYSVDRMTERYLACFEEVSLKANHRDYRANLPSPFPVMPSCRSNYPAWLRKIKWRLVGAKNLSTDYADSTDVG